MGQTLQPDLARLEKSPRDLERWQKAQRQLLAGSAAGALPVYRDLTQRFPGILNLWFELGAAAAGDLDFALACHAYERARALASADPAALVMIGQQFHRLRQIDRARACFQQAVEADPSSVHARLSWAAWLERERRLDQAAAQVDACLASRPNEPAALYYRAFLLHRAGRQEEAERLLRNLAQGSLSDPNVKISCFHLLGVVLDNLGQYAEAMDWLHKAKALVRQNNNVAALEQAYDKADRQRRALLERLMPDMIQRWQHDVPAEQFRFKLALLGGHPRSGTTLMEQILGAHPAVRAFDESEAFVAEVGDKLAPPPPATPLSAQALHALPAARRDALRRRYFRSLFREVDGEPDAEVLLDKNPTPTASLHLWLRVFPESKILIALRDPRDVVISCFFQNLTLTPLNVNFLSLDRTVKHYADLMDTWLRLRELGGFEWLETRYEDVVGGLEAEGRRVTQFLGLSWHADQASYNEAAPRKIVYSPTYGEVAKPVHDRAVGRWRNYATALEPFLPRLATYARAFGYES
ncbi:MAG TPA: sulfotransferase [Verrucomicrobiae bacterium]|jgi:tetratricopeptide (TPR) repeat protein|nr:sulfotransferase [Verrucomicrobiae bacterium]